MVKFAIKTLGCKVNQYEGQVVRENLLKSGFIETETGSADIVIINSCTVTEQADKKTVKLVKGLKRKNPRAKVFVTGCSTVIDTDINALQSLTEVHKVIPGVDKLKFLSALGLSLGGRNTIKIPGREWISAFDSHTRAFLKIQDGCDQNCSYCKVRLVRGPSRCKSDQDILNELACLTAQGYREVVLTGICLGAWKGKGGCGLAGLLKKVDGLDGDFRVRLSSIEPNHITEDLLKTIRSSAKICKHLHIPLQSGSDRILKLMNRRYTRRQFRKLIKQVRKYMPFVGLSMDVIVGFPGETARDFDRTRRFLEEIAPSRLHVFRYSDRKGTRAFDLKNKLPLTVMKERVASLIELGRRLEADFYRKSIGKKATVLVERRSSGNYLEGYTGEYLRVRLKTDPFSKFEGEFREIGIEKVDGSSVYSVIH